MKKYINTLIPFWNQSWFRLICKHLYSTGKLEFNSPVTQALRAQLMEVKEDKPAGMVLI